MIAIPHRWRSEPAYTDEAATDLRSAVLEAVAKGADLSGAYLSGAYLRGADLSVAYLRGADLSGADLRGADLSGADLSGADLSGTKVAWQSHDLVAELLRRAIPTPESAADLRPVDLRRHALIGLILANRGWCWADFARMPLSKGTRRWALKTLAAYKVDGDDAPPLIARAAERIKARQALAAGPGHLPENGAEAVDPPPPG